MMSAVTAAFPGSGRRDAMPGTSAPLQVSFYHHLPAAAEAASIAAVKGGGDGDGDGQPDARLIKKE
jgi:hypothetical protein